MTVACIIDTVKTEELFNDLPKYRAVFFINTKKRATKIYSEAKKRTKDPIVISISTKDLSVAEKIAVGIAREFAGYKEPIHIWVDDRCVVY
jgi:hypothetical protein